MKVAFVTNLAPYYCRPLFAALSEAHDVDYYLFSRGAERFVTPQLARDALSQASADYARWEIAGHAFVPSLASRLQSERYDVVVKCLNGKLMVPWVVGLARARGMPLIVWTGMWYHPRTPFHRMTARLTRCVYSQASALVVYGDHVRRFLVGHEGVPACKIFVAGQAVDGSRFELAAEARAQLPSAPEVVYVGQLEVRKGIRQLLDAFSGVMDPSARLTIIGDGSLRTEVEDRSRADRRIEMAGFVSQDELPARLAAARCLVLPSITTKSDREPWGLVVNEGMHAGLPIIATDAVGAAAGGLVEHLTNGIVVGERDVAGLRAALIRLLGHPALARSMGDRARESVREFTYERMVVAFEAAMRFAVDKGR